MSSTDNAATHHAIANRLSPKTNLFIDGAFRPSISGSRFETINPATGEVIASVAHAHAEDVNLAVAAARRTFEAGTWSATRYGYM